MVESTGAAAEAVKGGELALVVCTGAGPWAVAGAVTGGFSRSTNLPAATRSWRVVRLRFLDLSSACANPSASLAIESSPSAFSGAVWDGGAGAIDEGVVHAPNLAHSSHAP